MMLQWNHEHLHRLVSESTPHKVFDLAVHLTQDMGMEFIGLRVRIQLAAQSPRIYLYKQLPCGLDRMLSARRLLQTGRRCNPEP